VTASDGTLSTYDDFHINAVSAPALTSALTVSGLTTNLDVTSNLVFSVVTESVTAVATLGTHFIRITDLTALGLHDEAYVNTQTIDVSTAVANGLLSITSSGGVTHIVINPVFDLDFSSNYSVSIDAGAFIGTTSGQGSVAFDATTFNTVTPGSTSLVNAVQSQAMNDSTGALAASYKWLDIEGIGSPLGNATALGSVSGVGGIGGAGTNYALVIQDSDRDTLSDSSTSGIKVNDFHAGVTFFGLGDLFYVDNVNNAKVDNLEVIAPLGDSPVLGTTEISFDPNGVGGLGGVMEFTGPGQTYVDYTTDPNFRVIAG